MSMCLCVCVLLLLGCITCTQMWPVDKISHVPWSVCLSAGFSSHRFIKVPLKVLEFSSSIFQAWKVLEKRSGP